MWEGMASNGEKGQRVPTEALSRSRNDHEQFLEAYEKPTQIYRFLKARHTLKPLYLHRNLSYMQLNSRRLRRRQRKLRLTELINHIRDEKPDIASEIKSDNHLKIAFYGLERGIDFQKLLAKGSWESPSPEKSHDCQVMEVEVLLYRFRQPSAEALMAKATSCPCSCMSLGKYLLEYNPSSDTQPSEISQSLKTKEVPILSIPESKLNWEGAGSHNGTQMLVFRASHYDKSAKKNLSKKALRKGFSNVSIELNRLNHTEFASQIAKAKQQSQFQSQVSEKSKTSQGTTTAATPEPTSGTVTKLPQQHPTPQRPIHLQPIGGMCTSIPEETSKTTMNGTTSLSNHVDASHLPNTGMIQRRARPKGQKEKKDACVMTDLCYGTTIINNLSPLSPPPPTKPVGTFRVNNPTSPPPSQTEFTDKCTSPLIPKFQFKNGLGILNGLSLTNGSATVEEIEAPITKGKLPPPPSVQSDPPSSSKDLASEVLMKDPETGETFTSGNMEEPTHPPLVISIPRAYYDCPSRSSSTSSMSSDTSTASKKFRGMHSRRRSEIQLLLDGDKPPGQRIKAQEIPVFTAEDVANRSTRSSATTPPKSPWLGSSTRKITPVEHFNYPLPPPSPKRYTITGMCINRKRSLADSTPTPGASPPPAKVLKMEEPESAPPLFVEHTQTTVPNLAVEREMVLTPPIIHQELPPKPLSHPELPPEPLSHPDLPPEPISHPDLPPEPLSHPDLPPEPLSHPEFPPEPQIHPELLPEPLSHPELPPKPVSHPELPPKPVSHPELPPKPVSHPELLPEPQIHPELLPELTIRPELPPEPPSRPELLPEPQIHPDLPPELTMHPELSPEPPSESESSLLPLEPSPNLLPQTEAKPDKNNPTRTQDIFTADLVVHDSRGDCLLEDGVYSLLMQKCPEKEGDSAGLLTFVPLTWSSVFGGDKDLGEGESNNMLLKFSLQWTNGQPKNRLASAMTTALDLKKLREEYYPPLQSRSFSSPPPPLPHPPSPPPPPHNIVELEPPDIINDCSQEDVTSMNVETTDIVSRLPPSKERLIFNFLYNNNTLQQTELREDLHCPWCFLACGKLYSLLKHMSLSHPRFLYTYMPMEGGTAIDVHVNKLYDAGASSHADPGERGNLGVVQRRKGPSRCLPCTALLVERHAEVDEDLSEFLNDGTWKRGYTTNRMYYQARSSLPMLPDELEDDSKQEEDTLEWHKMCSQKMIEDFTDVNRGEKELMKLWNLYAMENRLIADKQVPIHCLTFAQEQRQAIKDKGIVHNFMAHLISLCDYGLIPPHVIGTSMAIIFGGTS